MQRALILVTSVLVFGGVAPAAVPQEAPAARGPAAAPSLGGSPETGRPVGPSVFVAVTPIAGGETKSAAVGGDGEFELSGLAPGRYRLAITSRPPKQTQGATFGERVNAGLQAAGSAVADGSVASAGHKTKHDTVKNSISNVRARESGRVAQDGPVAAAAEGRTKIDGGMPNRISMNVTVSRATHLLELDGQPVEVEVGPGGVLAGRVGAE